jgi:cell division septation protein DedD
MNRRLLVAASLLIASAAPLSAQSVKAGIDAWQRADYAGAVSIWRPLAEKGDADAEFNLGQAYRLGRGVPTNLAAAKTWFERAASQGHVDAETTLGLLLFQNGNQAEGLGWLKKAADQGEPRALLVYGTALVNGDSVTQDPVLGYAYVSRAAAQGLQPARDTLDQLDQILPIADRKRGAAIARELAKSAPSPSSAPVKTPSKPVQTAKAAPAPKPAPKPASKAVAVAEALKAPPKAPGHSVAPVASGSWRIQLGAFSQKASAEALYGRLAGKPALAGRRAFYIPVGPITRLQAGPFESKAAAEAACRSVGVACFPVPGK